MKCKLCEGEMSILSEEKSDVSVTITWKCEVCGWQKKLMYILVG